MSVIILFTSVVRMATVSDTASEARPPRRRKDPLVPPEARNTDNEAADEGVLGTAAAATTTTSATRQAARGTMGAVALRLVSFLGTQWCYRRLDPVTLGRASVKLELLLTGVLFISREGFRLALTTATTKTTENAGTAWLTIPATAVLSATALLWHWTATAQNGSDNDYRLAGILYCIAAALEGFAEPAVLYFLRHLSVAEKASAEGMAVLTKTATTVLALQYLASSWPVTAFGIAQIAYAVVYFVVLYGRLWMVIRNNNNNNNSRQQPRIALLSSSWSSMFHGPTVYMTLIFTLQGILKLALTEGDRIVMALLADSYDQGVYAMGSAYGGLAARLLLQPTEESARLLFSRLAASNRRSSTSTSSGSPTEIDNDTNRTNETAKDDNKDQANRRQKKPRPDPLLELSYTVFVKMVLYVGLIFSCLAVNYTHVLLHLLAGRKWGDNYEAVNVLSAFCVYTAFLAWNGMTEAFVYGVASSAADVGKISVAHAVTGLLFAVAAPFAVARSGTVGLVAANCTAMLGRAFFSVQFAARYFATTEKPVSFVLARLLRQMFPAPLVLLSFSLAYFGTRVSANRMLNQVANTEMGNVAWLRLAVEHISVGAAFGIGILTLAYSLERDFRMRVQILWNDKTA